MLDLTATIVTFNSDFNKLAKTVETFNKCTLSKDLIIHDNSSDPDYREKLNNLHITKVLDGPNKGFGYGHNRAFEQCVESKYHLILNPDVEIPEGTLEKMIQFMELNPDVGLTSPKILNPDGSIQMLNKRDPSFFNLFARRFLPKSLQDWMPVKKRMDFYIMKDKGYESNYEVPYLSGCFMLFRTEIFKKLQGFDEKFFMYLEDADITRRSRLVCKCMYFSETSIIHHWERGSYNSWKLTWISIKSSFYYFWKWRCKKQNTNYRRLT